MARSNSSIVLFDYIPHDISKLISMTAFFTPKMTTIDIELLIQLRLSLKVKNFDQSTSKREMHNGRVYYEIDYAMHVRHGLALFSIQQIALSIF